MNLASCAIADLAGGFGYRNLPSRNPGHWQNSRDFFVANQTARFLCSEDKIGTFKPMILPTS
jgi:hypothetical protein